ncbi:MAG: hypothetical protein KAY59_07280 [Acidobacteria bacterium]|nr:hypothetical protein [Acidobacteriota bacterium]
MKWDTAFRVVAHELRSPAGVISGYTRLLKSGRLDADGEASALAQIDRASERLQNLGEAAAGLSHWLEPKNGGAGQTFDVLALVDQAMLLTSARWADGAQPRRADNACADHREAHRLPRRQSERHADAGRRD